MTLLWRLDSKFANHYVARHRLVYCCLSTGKDLIIARLSAFIAKAITGACAGAQMRIDRVQVTQPSLAAFD